MTERHVILSLCVLVGCSGDDGTGESASTSSATGTSTGSTSTATGTTATTPTTGTSTTSTTDSGSSHGERVGVYAVLSRVGEGRGAGPAEPLRVRG